MPVLISGSAVDAASTVAPKTTPERPKPSASRSPLCSRSRPAPRVTTEATAKRSSTRCPPTCIALDARTSAAWPRCTSWPPGALPAACQGSVSRERAMSQSPATQMPAMSSSPGPTRATTRVVGRKWPITETIRTAITSAPSSTSTSEAARYVSGVPLRRLASSTTSTMVWIAMPPRMLPMAIPRSPLMAALGAEIATGGDHRTAFEIVGAPHWRELMPRAEDLYGGFQPDDCYPDALPAVQELCARGYRVAILANQPARRTPELRALGFEPDVMAMSDEMGVSKPDAAFVQRALDVMGGADPELVADRGA